MVILLVVHSEAAAGTRTVLADGFCTQSIHSRELKNEPLPLCRHWEEKKNNPAEQTPNLIQQYLSSVVQPG